MQGGFPTHLSCKGNVSSCSDFTQIIKGFPIAKYWKTNHEDFASLVFGGYMIYKKTASSYQLTEGGIEG
jgi:hypothetical protein